MANVTSTDPWQIALDRAERELIVRALREFIPKGSGGATSLLLDRIAASLER